MLNSRSSEHTSYLQIKINKYVHLNFWPLHCWTTAKLCCIQSSATVGEKFTKQIYFRGKVQVVIQTQCNRDQIASGCVSNDCWWLHTTGGKLIITIICNELLLYPVQKMGTSPLKEHTTWGGSGKDHLFVCPRINKIHR